MFQNIAVNHMTFNHARVEIDIEGLPESPISGLRLTDLARSAATGMKAYSRLETPPGLSIGPGELKNVVLEGNTLDRARKATEESASEYSLTPEGRRAFQEYIRTLEEIVRQSLQPEEPEQPPAREIAPVLQRGVAAAK